MNSYKDILVNGRAKVLALPFLYTFENIYDQKQGFFIK